MNFLRLHDPLLSVLFEDDEIVAVNKPYGIDTHTNDSKVGNADFIQHGLIELFEKQLRTKLHIVHRLDKTTTGVIVFAKSLEAAKKYQGYFRARETKKTYLFITDKMFSKDELMSDRDIIHKGANLEAKTEFSRLNRTSRFELWQAKPLTGRNHQIRIHSADVGVPILGDANYGGSPFPFLCLHNRRIDFPNGVTIETAPPIYFEDLRLLNDVALARALFDVDRRRRLFSERVYEDQCFRLIHKRRGDDRGYSLDQFGKVLQLSWYKEAWLESDREMFRRLSEHLKKPILVRFMNFREKDASKGARQVLLSGKGESTDLSEYAAGWSAHENQVKSELRTDSGQSSGLFLDQRLQRNWVLENSKGRSVLNLFSYTCGFSVAAALGGAREVISVDTNKNVLNWGRRNFELNGLDPSESKFFCRDSVSYLEQCLSKKLKFDLIICDPPVFSRGEKKGIFKIESSLEPLLKSCLACLNDGGDFLFSTNYENFAIDDIRRAALKVQGALGLKFLEISSIQSALDFELPGERTALASFLFHKPRQI